jgi:hypothetical protein
MLVKDILYSSRHSQFLSPSFSLTSFSHGISILTVSFKHR